MTETQANAAARSADDVWSSVEKLILAVTCAVLFLDGLDLSMVQVALPQMQQELHLSTSSAQWIVSAFVLGYGGLLLLGGRCADIFGRRRVLVTALVVFVFASLLGTVVSDDNLLIGSRFIKGVTAAFTAPAALSILSTTFAEGHHRNKALGIFTTAGGGGVVFGLVTGGLLTELSWRWTFGLIVPAGALVLLAALRVVPKDPPTHADTRGRLDILGAVVVTAGLLLLVRAVVRAPELGWGASETVISFAIAVALIAAFVAIEGVVKYPLVRPSLLRTGALVRANIGAIAVMGGSTAYNIISTLYYQNVLGWSPLKAGLIFMIAPFMMANLASRVGPLTMRFGTPLLIAVGSAFSFVGWALFLAVDTSANFALIVPSLVLHGIGFALCYPALNIQALTGVPEQEQGVAGGLLNSFFQIGSALVLSIATAVLIANTSGVTATDRVDGYHAGIYVALIAAVIGFITALVGVVQGRRAAMGAFVEQGA